MTHFICELFVIITRIMTIVLWWVQTMWVQFGVFKWIMGSKTVGEMGLFSCVFKCGRFVSIRPILTTCSHALMMAPCGTGIVLAWILQQACRPLHWHKKVRDWGDFRCRRAVDISSLWTSFMTIHIHFRFSYCLCPTLYGWTHLFSGTCLSNSLLGHSS